MSVNPLRCSSSDCSDCSLADENKELRRELEKLLQAIQGVQSYCLHIYSQAARVMSRHQPRGTWSLWKGKGEVAREIFNRLAGEG